MNFASVSWLGAVLAAVAFFALGGVWYGPLFGKTWMRLSGVTDAQVQASNMITIFAGTLLLELVGAIGLAAVIGPDAGVAAGAGVGAVVGVLVVAAALAVQALYERRPPMLWVLNAGYNAVGFAVMGAIIGAFQ